MRSGSVLAEHFKDQSVCKYMARESLILSDVNMMVGLMDNDEWNEALPANSWHITYATK